MINRRRFLQGIAAAAAAPPAAVHATRAAGFGPLLPDPGRILDLPSGFRYDIVARRGEPMDDGLLVPDEADGMAAFKGCDGNIALVCNHEISPGNTAQGPFGENLEHLSRIDPASAYDFGKGRSPCNGGTSTIVYDPAARRKLRQHMSLVGTELNCCGGPTPWGSWLSCEECFTDPGTDFDNFRLVTREQRHGYVFEVPALHTGAVAPVPLTGLGRFEHEAAAVDPSTGIVYLSEDRHRSLLYRFVPQVPGALARGGTLQALAISGRPQFDTRNWGARRDLDVGKWLDAYWLDLPDPDGNENDLRFSGYALGAARFARGEGLTWAEGDVVMSCTIGGAERLGQVFRYRATSASRGKLMLLAESGADSLLRNADNLTYSPWGDIVVCEDTAGHCGLIGIQPDGHQYPIADNAYTASELAGACFAPDGSVLFVNIQHDGLTLAITGPWQAA